MAETRQRDLARGVAFVALVGILGVVLAAQGWRARMPGTDVIPYIDSAHALLSHGRLPDRGVVTSLSSYAPPGFAWIVAPGMLLFSEPRVFDVPGTAVLYLGTLLGIFVLARACAGVRCAFLAVLLYGVSERGLAFAATLGPGSLGPRGHPFFYVWMAYFTCRWVAARDSRFLAAALLTWLIGMFVFMEIAPALFMLPAVWAFYRPPVQVRTLAAAGVIGFVVWYPYLRFDATRNFADIRSQLLLESIAPADSASALCDPTLTPRRWPGSPEPVADFEPTSRLARLVVGAGRRALAFERGLAVNFEGRAPGTELALLAMTVGGLLAMSVRQREDPLAHRDAARAWQRWATTLAIGLFTYSIVANERVVDHLARPLVHVEHFPFAAVRGLQAMAALCGVALLTRARILRSLRSLAVQRDPTPCDVRVLGIALVVPWAMLLLIAEWGREDRLAGLWPLQVIVLAFFIGRASAQLDGLVRFVRWAVPLLVTGALLANPLVWSHIESWRHDGWSGVDPAEIPAVDYLARVLGAAGKDRAVIGHRLFLDAAPEPPWRAADTSWRVGGELDVMLEYGHGIVNLNKCPEGLTPQDEYRIVEMYPPGPEAALYFDVPSAGHLRLLEQIGQYQLYKRE